MTKLFYGNGIATIEGSEIIGVQIKYSGSIKVEKTAGDNFVLAHANNGILIFPLGEGYLNELFNYNGTMKIISVMAVDNNGERVPCTVKRVMDYSELLDSTSETITIPSEDLSAGYGSNKKITETPQIIENLHTKDKSTPSYLKDGSVYEGYFHIHLKDASSMTGAVHDKDSQILYMKKFKHGKVIEKLVPIGRKK